MTAVQMIDGVDVVTGTVVPGDQRGRLLGFPTANVSVPSHALQDGVWTGTVLVAPGPGGTGRTDGMDGTRHIAAVSVGRRPTYYDEDGERLLEAHLLDFDGDLYGRDLRIDLHVRLRPQRSYTSSTELVDQLRRDVEATRQWAQDAGLGHLLDRRQDRSR